MKKFVEPGAERVRRFWKEATVGEGGEIRLDGRPLKTPARRPLALPTPALADLVAGEWNAQGEFLDAGTMPATRLAYTAIDRVADVRTEVADEIARYAGSDMLCYFAEGPAELTAREEEAWGPWLDWAERALDLRLARTAGVIHTPQPPEAISRVRAVALDLDDFSLAGLALATPLFGSAVLALAVQRGVLQAPSALDVSRLDEAFQEQQWGVDAEAAERTAGLRLEAVLIQRWFDALR